MKCVAFVNHKGGVGKTSCSMAFAQGLSRRGLKTLLIDLDQQMNATQTFGIDSSDLPSIYDLLTSDEVSLDEAIIRTATCDIVPGDLHMVGIERAMSDLMSPNTKLDEVIEQLDGSRYDYVVMDCPPTLGYVTINAMVAADELIVVVQPDGASVTGAEGIFETASGVQANRRLNPDLRVGGILVNFYDYNRRLSREADCTLPRLAEKQGTKVYESRIRSCEAMRQAMKRKESLYDYAPECNAARDFGRFIDEYLEEEK